MAYGMPVPPEGEARTADEAVKLAHVIGYPVVMKVSSPDIAHKTDVGGVAVNLRSDDEVAIRQAGQLARSLERAAVYLHGHTFDQMSGDATLMVRSKPWQAVMIAFLVGAIFGRGLRRDRF